MNIPEILKHYNIPYIIGPTKNVGIGVVGINCPYCQDSSNHLGIFENGHWSCWKCRRKGTLFQLLRKLRNINYEEYVLVIKPEIKNLTQDYDLKKLIEARISRKPISISEIEPSIFPLPKEAKPIPDNPQWELLNKFLAKRQFTTRDCQLWGAKYADSGEYNSRLILPILDINKKLVGFQAKDVTGVGHVPYDLPKEFKIKNHLYGLWRAGKQIIVVEGILDVWRIGFGAVASFGKGLSKPQRNLLYNNAKEIIFAWDGDAGIEMQKEMQWWKGIGFSCKRIQLPREYDPDKFILKEGREAWIKLLEETK